jgi:hypothetical protein
MEAYIVLVSIETLVLGILGGFLVDDVAAAVAISVAVSTVFIDDDDEVASSCFCHSCCRASPVRPWCSGGGVVGVATIGRVGAAMYSSLVVVVVATSLIVSVQDEHFCPSNLAQP